MGTKDAVQTNSENEIHEENVYHLSVQNYGTLIVQTVDSGNDPRQGLIIPIANSSPAPDDPAVLHRVEEIFASIISSASIYLLRLVVLRVIRVQRREGAEASFLRRHRVRSQNINIFAAS